ncbi:hypothetical protein BDR26DRAFT_948318, partial [Obelidium mucronatum]
GHSKSNLLCPRHPKKVSYSSSSSSGSTFPVSFSINHGFRQEYLPANNQPPYVATLMSTPTSSVAVAQSLHQQRKNFQLMRAYELPLQSPPLEQVSPTPQGDRLPRDFPHDLSAQHETRALSAQVRMREDARIRQQHSRDTLSSEARAHRLAIDRARAQNRRNQSVSRESRDHQLAADRARVRNRRNQSRASLAQSKLQFHQFLLERELNFDFGAVETQKPVFLESMAKSLGFEFLLESVCAICELLFPKCELESCQLDNTLIENMKRSLIIDPTIVEDIPEFIRAYYNVSDIHADLGSMFLQRKGFSVSDLSTSVTLCTPCKSVIFNKKRKTPPEESIANGNWIGEIEQKFKSMSSVDKLSVALVVPGFVLKSLVADKEKKTLNSHFYALLNSRPFIQMIPSDASDSSRITLCGAFTSAQKAATLSREKWNAPLCRDFVDTYGGQNVFLRDHPNYIQPAENSDAQSIFVDRTDSSSNPVPERIVNMMSFGSTSYNSGASTDEIDTATELYDSTRNSYVYEQGREPSPIVSEDFAAFHSANYSKSRDLSDAPFMFVHLLPGVVDIPSPCPMPDCNGNVEAIPIAQEAFRRGRVGQPPVPTSQCASCSKLYAHSQLMTQRVRQFAAENNVDISPGAVDHFRCSPPLSAYDPSNPEHVCLLAMVLLDVQFHWAEHTGGCFKITSRTPLAIICRFIKPHMANLLKTCIDKDTGIIEWFRPIGNEYLNLCNVHLSFLLRFNLDEQSQVNGEFRRVSVYTCKYNTKYLSQDELLCMRIGQYTSAIESVLDDPSNSNLSVADLSGKILNKILYKITNPVGMPLTLLCIIIINGSLYVRSHEPIYWNAKQFYACYRQFDSPAGESNIFGPTQLAHPVEAEHIASNSSDSSDSNDSSNLNPESHDEFLEFSFYSSTIMSSAPPPANASMTAEQASLANEEENIITINPAIDFWYRPASLKSMCFRDILETQHLVRGSHKSKEMLPPHPFPAKRHWVDNRRPCRLVIRGQQIPYLEKPSITWEEKEFYYWIFLFLYKPHQNASELLYGQQSYQAAYQEFLVDESMAEFVQQARRHEDFNRNHYENCYAEKDPNYEADETRICREHQLNDPTINNQPAHSNEVENLLDLQFDILDDDIGFHFLSEQEEDESLLQSLPQGMKAIDINFSLLSGMPTFPQMPEFTNMDDYKKRLQDPGDMEASGLEGTTMFLQWNRENKILLLQECCTPVPWVDSSHLGPPDISQLQQFASISEISIAYRLDFFQHLAFQEVARHLMYSFITDIQYAGKLQIPLPHLALKPQLISFLGGEAGHGKSECIISLLTFVRLWGRRDTVEVLAPTNLTAMHLGGLTMHASRGLDIFKRKLALSAPSQKRIENAYLTVLEEASMMEQGDLGLADEVTRTIMGNDTVWGGKHVWMAADFLQFEPPTGPYIFKPLEGQDKPHASAPKALQLVNSINHSVFLTKNWRQKDDPPFAALLSRTHWGVNTSDDINLLNTRFVGSPTLEKAICGTPDIEFFAPIATPINVRRCALNRHILHRTASTNHQLIYQINAYSTKVTVRNQFKRLQHLDDDYTDKTPFLLSFVLGSPVMCTKKLRDSQFFSKGVIAFVVGYEADTSCGSDDAALFITSTVNNITFKRFRLQPLLLYLKIRGCSNVLVDGFPPGILGIPPWKGPIMTNIGGHGSLVKYPKKENRLWQPVCIQFPIILSYACTPEKMQGVTLKNHLIVTPLSRKGMKPQTLYVTLSRVKTLIALYLTERVTRQYLTKFRPPKHFVRKTLDLIQKIELPSYTPAHIMNSFDEWRSTQIRYAHQALHLS